MTTFLCLRQNFNKWCDEFFRLLFTANNCVGEEDNTMCLLLIGYTIMCMVDSSFPGREDSLSKYVQSVNEESE